MVALGSTALDRSRDHVVCGIAERGVATVDVVDAKGRGVRATVGTNAFLAVIGRKRMRRSWVALSRLHICEHTRPD